ncbi:MAG: V-type ATPase 116kDa subunit family protein [Dehalococcoidales bacterium]|nr:V-type ATPase 116kDa subunit family protein [Dehalococcoidales bacterium]
MTPPIIVNSPESMVKVRVVTLKDYSEQTLKTLHKVGVLHVEEAKDLKPVDRAAIESQRKEATELATFVNNMLGYLTEKEEVLPEEDVEVIYTRPFPELSREVRSLYTRFAGLYDRAVKTDNEIRELTEQKRHLGLLTQNYDLKLKDLEFSGDYLFSRVFVLPADAYQTLRDQIQGYLFESYVATVEDEAVLYLIAKVANRDAIESLINGGGGRALLIPDGNQTLGGFLNNAETRLQKLEESLSVTYQELQKQARQDVKTLVLFKGALAAERQRLSVLSRACEAKYVTSVEGWIPANSAETLVFKLKDSIEYIFVDTREPEESEEPPTKMKNPAPMRPFQVVVNLFATPKYREWDPTPIVAYSFAIFYGLMTADVVYAAGMILISRFLVPKFLGGTRSEAVMLLQRVLYICGGVGLVLGLLSGSYLGNIHTMFGLGDPGLVAGVQRLLQNPLIFVILALFIGFIHVNIGNVLALIKMVKERNRGAIVAKVGLFSLQFGALYIIRAVMNVDIPSVLGLIVRMPQFSPQVYDISLYFAIAGIGMIVAGNFIEKGGLGAILWLFDITGILGDIMSYARIAGVGLATYYLATVFNMLGPLFGDLLPFSGMVAVIAGGALSILILVIGHTVNLLLSVLTGFIHSLRLCFVEFLFKFYEGGGRIYSPFKLIKRQPVLVGAKS